ncbi:MAG: helix-turn-helix transcriptional regulator [Streptomyces sp.]|nr:helix-turn-helix transcriptional regulator [Streptomyces sp.]
MTGTGRRTLTRGQGSFRRGEVEREGRVAGYVLKAVRNTTGLTQDRLAERLGVDTTTVQGWESGRRPLIAISMADYLCLRQALLRLDAEPWLLRQLDVALEADRFLGYVLGADGPIDIENHPLATWVITRSFTDLVGWAISGKPPAVLADVVRGTRRGPAPSGPQLAVGERRHVVDHLRTAAEQAAPDTVIGALLLRQAHYIAGFDATPETTEWLAAMLRREQRRLRPDQWSPSWAVVRSGAHTLARQGDAEALPRFIRDHIAADECEVANLNYWSYWIGELSDPQLSDLFMIKQELGSWRGDRLLEHLVARLDAANPYVDVVAHTLWSLLSLKGETVTAPCDKALTTAVQRLFDEGSISSQSRRELQEVLYALRAMHHRG